MPRAQKLKVFRTPIGFHDAYVAAPSQKAALAAWGSDANLFARGVAEQVTNPELTAEPLARPGQVIRKLRGSAEEQLSALPRGSKASKRAAKPKPRPSRAALDEAEQAAEALEAKHRGERDALAKRQAAERRKIEQQLDRARTSYERAIERWQG
jgi:hypothetical protein